MSEANVSIWEKMQAIDRRWLYAILLVLTSAGLFIPVEVPVEPDGSTLDLYASLAEVDPEKTVLVQSDWTNSTRGENAGHFEALIRFLMARNQKFVVYSYGDPQAPQVARDALTRINQEREAAGRYVYKEFDDYVTLGYFPNAEAQTVSMDNNIRAAWGHKKVKDSTGKDRPCFESPVLQDINSVDDAGYLMIVTASSTIDIAVERLSDNTVPMGAMVTGDVGPQVLPYHQAEQVTGVGVGLKGVYEFEFMMNYGVNYAEGDEKPKVAHPNREVMIPPVEDSVTFGRGKSYYATLHIALTLLIIAVVVGNLGLALSKKGKGN